MKLDRIPSIIGFQPIIGLEIHVELKTKSKMFCGCSADYYGHEPNTHCCPVCLGLPGALPVPNKKAVEWCVMLGLALNCEIPVFSKFDRKNYFYPDLPKGYQISQYDKPFAVNGFLVIPSDPSAGRESRNLSHTQVNKLKQVERSLDGVYTELVECARDDKDKIIRIRRVHMEEDTGKLMHTTIDGEKWTLIDFNRSGVPLVEIVTEPDITSSEEARIFLKKLYQMIRYLGISDADMEKGSLRIEPNISIREIRNKNQLPIINYQLPRYKVEVKNINSFNFAKKAIDYEIERQIKLLERGETPKQETRGWEEKKGITYTQRSKEEADDYRYFPEPDIPPVHWRKSQISNLKSQIGELPDEKIKRFIQDYQLSEYDAAILTDERKTAEYFEEVINRKQKTENRKQITAKIIANWIINKKVDIKKVAPEELIKLIFQKQQVGAIGISELNEVIDEVIKENSKAVADYKSGKGNVIMFLVGMCLKKLKGQADAIAVSKLLEKKLQ